MNRIVYIPAFLIPITILFVGIYTFDQNIITSGFSLLFFVFMSFIGSSLKGIKKEQIDLSKLKIVIPLFVLSVAILIFSIYVDRIIMGVVFSFLAGTVSCVYLYKGDSDNSKTRN